MAGGLKTLFQALQASAFMSGVTLAYGEEMITAQEPTLPYVVMVPRGGPISEPGYAVDGSGGSEPDPVTKPPMLDVNTEDLWEIATVVQFYLWHSNPDGLPIDNADAVETLRLAMLSALRDQRAQLDASGNVYYGLAWKALREDWETAKEAQSRLGRALVLTVQIDTAVVMAPPTSGEVVVQTTQFNPSINNQPG